MDESVRTLLLALAVAVAGGVGAAARVFCDRLATQQWGQGQVAGILVVNVLGSLLLGLVVGAGWSQEWQRVIGTGLLGGFTTFSTAMLQAVDRERPLGIRALVHLTGTALLTVSAAGAGLLLTVS